MRILFAGPTLHGLVMPGERIAGTAILCRAPAQQGDIARAVLDGALAIGLVDGRYEDVAAPWHKEILFALDRDVRVCGGASMGALRAAECAAFGMIPIGDIAARYLDGTLTDDAAVAQIHGPPELGCVPLSEALVNVEATIEAAVLAEAIAPDEAAALRAAARAIFFKDRTHGSVVERAGFSRARAEEIRDALRAHKRDIKREDALALLAYLRNAPDAAPAARTWTFRQPTAWRRFLASLETESVSSPG